MEPHQEGASIGRPPFLTGENYSHWKCLARLAIQDKIPKCLLTRLSYSYSDYLTLKTKTLLRGQGM
uniref:Uncharacterized protein n=1 Tax=Vitis vinifera TaxID=29760 RepID=F6GWU0_VITVI